MKHIVVVMLLVALLGKRPTQAQQPAGSEVTDGSVPGIQNSFVAWLPNRATCSSSFQSRGKQIDTDQKFLMAPRLVNR